MRINRVYLPWWLALAVLPVYVLFLGFKGLVCLFLAAMKALDKHNRRRAVRKAYERDQAYRAAVRAQMAQATANGLRWQDHRGHPRNAWTGEPMDWGPSAQPQDDPNWRPRSW